MLPAQYTGYIFLACTYLVVSSFLLICLDIVLSAFPKFFFGSLLAWAQPRWHHSGRGPIDKGRGHKWEISEEQGRTIVKKNFMVLLALCSECGADRTLQEHCPACKADLGFVG